VDLTAGRLIGTRLVINNNPIANASIPIGDLEQSHFHRAMIMRLNANSIITLQLVGPDLRGSQATLLRASMSIIRLS
jgi:hypothetical protein